MSMKIKGIHVALNKSKSRNTLVKFFLLIIDNLLVLVISYLDFKFGFMQ